MLKYVGLVLVCVSIAVFGVVKSEEIKKALALRKSVTELLYSMENAVSGTGKGKLDIYRDFAENSGKLSTFLDQMAKGEDERKCVEKHLSSLCENDRKMLAEFFSDFGKYKDCESQVKMCRYFIKEFERAGQENEKEQRNRILLYRKLGIIFALVTAVIFL